MPLPTANMERSRRDSAYRSQPTYESRALRKTEPIDTEPRLVICVLPSISGRGEVFLSRMRRAGQLNNSGDDKDSETQA